VRGRMSERSRRASTVAAWSITTTRVLGPKNDLVATLIRAHGRCAHTGDDVFLRLSRTWKGCVGWPPATGPHRRCPAPEKVGWRIAPAGSQRRTQGWHGVSDEL